MDNNDPDILSETESFVVWRSEEDGDITYHVELGGITLHINSEDWEEFVVLMKGVD